MKKRKIIISILTTLLLILTNKVSSVEIEIPDNEIKDGVVLQVNNDFIFLKGNYREGELIQLSDNNFVRVISGKKKSGRNIIIPVEIPDIELSRGQQIKIKTKDEEKIIDIPKRRVFIPNKFYLVYRGLGEKGENGGQDGTLILEVWPKLSYLLKVNVNDTADDGLVVNFGYENIVKGKIYDILDELGRRDINLSGDFKYDKTREFKLQGENIFERRAERKIGLLTTQPLAKRLSGKIRIDNFKHRKKISIGGNIIYTRGNKEFNFGQVTSVIDDFLHFEMHLQEKYGNIILRGEDFSSYEKTGLTIKRLGGQINLEDKNGNLKFSIGNLIIGLEDNPYKGCVDDKLNFSFEYLGAFGNYYAPPDIKKIQFGAVWSAKIIGVEDNAWIRGRLSIRTNLNSESYVQYSLSDDFVDLWGKNPHPPWQNRSLTIIRNRKLFEDKTLIGKADLDYIFCELSWKRTNYEIPFSKTQNVKFGFGKTLEVVGIPLPLEFFVEKEKNKEYKYGVILSFRSYL